MPRSAADVLLELLDHADAASLEVLLQPESLLALLMHEGRSKNDVRRDLARGRIPGELLLELFKRGRKTDELLAIVAAAGPTAGPVVPPAPAATPRASTSLLSSHRPVHRIGLFVVFAAIVPGILAMMDAHLALALLRAGMPAVLSGVAFVGAVGGAIFAKDRAPWFAGAVGGALAALGANGAILGYMFEGPGAGRGSVMRLELAIAALLGAAPGALVYLGVARVTRLR